MANTLTVSLPSEREIAMTREFDAPRDLVFTAFSSAQHMAQWWGPRDMQIPVCEVDFRPGGAWHAVHRDSAGAEYAFRGEYREIVPPERIVWTFEFDGMPGLVSVETLMFEDLGGRTRIVARSTFDSGAHRDGMLQSGMETGAAETYDRLAEYLRTLA